MAFSFTSPSSGAPVKKSNVIWGIVIFVLLVLVILKLLVLKVVILGLFKDHGEDEDDGKHG